MPKSAKPEDSLRLFIARLFISLVILIPTLYVVLSKEYPAETQKWATGLIGVVVGYWFR